MGCEEVGHFGYVSFGSSLRVDATGGGTIGT
jgi:hypothetical protein